MFSNIFRKWKPEEIPKGYPSYSAKDFEEKLKVTHEQSMLIEDDYLSLVQFDKKTEFVAMVFGAGPDLYTLSKAIQDRYKLGTNYAGNVALFFAKLASARTQQNRCHDLGISKCIWLGTSACALAINDANTSHATLSGQQFDPSVGLPVDGGYLLPGVALGCHCISRPVLRGLA